MSCGFRRRSVRVGCYASPPLLLRIAAFAAAAILFTARAQAYGCDSGVLQMAPPPQGDDGCFTAPLSSNSIKAACLPAVRVRVKAGVVKLVPLLQASYPFMATPVSSTAGFDCKDLNASGLLFPGSTTGASVMLYDDYGGPLSNLTKTGAGRITLSAARTYNSTSFGTCKFNYTVAQGCVFGIRAPAKPAAACPVGHTKTTGRFGISFCAPCAPGTYAPTPGAACTPCPAGTYGKAPGAAACTKCAKSYYSKAGAVECDYCDEGARWTDGRTCRECPAGSRPQAAGAGAGPRCVRCYAGRRCCVVGWGSDCPKCTQSSAPASYSSILALEGTTPGSCLATGAALCSPKLNITVDGTCTVTITNNRGTYNPQLNPDDRTVCAWITMLPIKGAQFSVADLAKLDYLYLSQGTASLVVAGNATGGPSPYATLDIPGIKCALRYRILTAPAAALLGAAPQPGNATTCPAGHYQDTTTDAPPGPCLPCPPGTYSPRPSSGRGCSRCPAGTYANRYSSKKCRKCPAGRASKPGAASCIFCDPGSHPRPGGKGCVACPKDSEVRYVGAGGQCLGNAYGTVCCAAGNCTGQAPCNGPRQSMKGDLQTYTAILQLVSKSLPQPACRNASFLACLPANGRLQVYSESTSPTVLYVEPYRSASTCRSYAYTFPYRGGYTSTKNAFVTLFEDTIADSVAFGMVADRAKGTVTMYLSPPAIFESDVRRVPAKAAADCSATFKITNGYAFDLAPPPGAKCGPADGARMYGGRRFCASCGAGEFRNATSGLCQRCRGGTYSATAGAAVCKRCPVGYACSEGARAPTACVYGLYGSRPAQAACASCPANSYGIASYDVPTTKCSACPKGTIAPRAAVACGVPWDTAFPA